MTPPRWPQDAPRWPQDWPKMASSEEERQKHRIVKSCFSPRRGVMFAMPERLLKDILGSGVEVPVIKAKSLAPKDDDDGHDEHTDVDDHS